MMLESLFVRVLNMSMTGSLMILAVLLVRVCLIKAPKLFSYMLWIVVLFRLLCPVSFESSFSLLGVLGITAGAPGTVEYISRSPGAGEQNGEAVTIPEATAMEAVTAEITDMEAVNPETAAMEEINPEAAAAEEGRPVTMAMKTESPEPGREEVQEKTFLWSKDRMQAGLRAGSVVWVTGAVCLLLYGSGSYMRLRRKLHMAEAKTKEQGLPDLFDEADVPGETAIINGGTVVSGAADRKHIYRTDAVSTAFVLGFIRPGIYLPNNLEEKEESYILLHEQIHIKRKDSLYRTAAYLALCLHWFNPLVWLAFHMSGIDMEMSCDEAVIRKIGSGFKKEYSNSLLSLATGRAGISGVPLAFGEGDTGSRIKNVLRYKKPAVIVVSVAAMLCLAAAVFLLANPKGEAEESVEDTGVGADMNWTEGSDVQADINYNILPYLLTEYGGNFPDGIYRIEVRSVSESARGIDQYGILDIANEWGYNRERPILPFDDDCVFLVNRELYYVQYEEVSFEEFNEAVTEVLEYRYPMVYVKYADGQIVEASLNDAYYGLGFSAASLYDLAEAAQYEPDYGWLIRNIQDDTGLSGEEVIEEYFTLVRTERADVSDAAGEETIEIYTGSTGSSGDDSESGIVVVRDSNGNMLHTSTADTLTGTWNNIYLTEIEGTFYLMEVTVLDWDTRGRYSYDVYRLGENGEWLYNEASRFEFDDAEIGYDDELFHVWVDRLVYYLENSHLLLSTQEREIRTEPVSDADKYNYETLRRGGAAFQRDAPVKQTTGQAAAFENNEMMEGVTGYELTAQDILDDSSDDAWDSYAFIDIESGQYALSGSTCEIKEGEGWFEYVISWDPTGNYIRVGLITEDKSSIYYVTCVGGEATSAADISQIPAGNYYVIVYNETSSNLALTGAIAYKLVYS